MKTSAGFTLIELMIVVAIIAIIAAIAMPNLLRSRLQSNEASAIQDLRSILGAEYQLNSAKGIFGDFTVLTDNTQAGLYFMDSTWVDGAKKHGYTYTMASADNDDFLCYADPISPGKSGVRYFRVDASGVIRYSTVGRPTVTDTPLSDAR